AMPSIDVAGEFETIRRLFAPLAHPEYARGLMDDVAVLPSRSGFDLVLTKDAVVEGVHFLANDPLDTVAQKLLRVNLSDLVAKGAE
ncbi:MAG: AIR synthase related protein, partial [Brevundimonas aurantiaca]|uniref:AIR synthase related protein n=1 Tax=Brevundimonas aurantiaca TaxID=74316 RepID=UPI0040336C3B